MFYLRGKADDLSSLKKSNWEIPPVPAALWRSLGSSLPPCRGPTTDLFGGTAWRQEANLSVQTSGWSKFRIPVSTQNSPKVKINIKYVSSFVTDVLDGCSSLPQCYSCRPLSLRMIWMKEGHNLDLCPWQNNCPPGPVVAW